MLVAFIFLSGCLYIGEGDLQARKDDWDQDGYEAPDAGGDDCDDGDPQVHPRTLEVCGDHVDNDCDGGPGDCRPTGSQGLVDADRTWRGRNEGDLLGTAVALAGDPDDDGWQDVLVGSPRESRGAYQAGVAYLFSADPAQDGRTASAEILGQVEGEDLGTAVAGPGDLDGDGVDDILVGGTRIDSPTPLPGVVSLWYGPLSGIRTLNDADALVEGEIPSDYLGFSMAGAGDVDGDGRQDLLLSASSASLTGPGWDGLVYVVTGPFRPKVSLAEARARLSGVPGSYAGAWLAAGTDGDGDGVPDLAIGAHGAPGQAGEVGAGVAWLVSGTVEGSLDLPSAAYATVWGTHEMDRVGYHLAQGDWSQDGYADLAVAALEQDSSTAQDAGAVYYFEGPLSGDVLTTGALASWEGPWELACLGSSVEGAGDVDGDGQQDLLVSAAGREERTEGSAWVLWGPLTDASLAQGLRLDGKDLGDNAGWALSGARDVDQDGFSDVLLGAWGSDTAATDAGAAYLVLGTGM